MSKEAPPRRFGPEHWVTLRATGEHVQIEAWSPIKSAYRVRSRKRGVFLASAGALNELQAHPGADRGRHWNRCPAVGCGAPLTPDLPTCARCKAQTCSCGRCGCSASRTSTKKAVEKTPAKAI